VWILRAVLVFLNGSAILFFCYVMLFESQNGSQRLLTLALESALVLNLIYLIASPPAGKNESRLWRLGRLWLDAKENELRRRADKNSN
jgi:hypothetical protein